MSQWERQAENPNNCRNIGWEFVEEIDALFNLTAEARHMLPC